MILWRKWIDAWWSVLSLQNRMTFRLKDDDEKRKMERNDTCEQNQVEQTFVASDTLHNASCCRYKAWTWQLMQNVTASDRMHDMRREAWIQHMDVYVWGWLLCLRKEEFKNLLRVTPSLSDFNPYILSKSMPAYINELHRLLLSLLGYSASSSALIFSSN